MTDFDDDKSWLPPLPAYDLFSANKLLHMMSRAFEEVPYAVAVVDLDRTVQYANQPMIDIAKGNTGLAFDEGRVTFADAQIDAAFATALGRIVSREKFDTWAEAFAVLADDEAQSYSAWVGPLSGYQASVDPTTPTAAVISLAKQSSETPIDWGLLHDVFELSSREADIANRLLAGDDVGTMARDLGVSVGTVGARLKAILNKTGCRGQEELVAILRQLREAR